MFSEKIQDGYEVFTHDGEKAFGTVRKVLKDSILIYIENAGDFEIPFSAIKDVHSEKIILDAGKLEHGLKQAIARAHSSEDPRL